MKNIYLAILIIFIYSGCSSKKYFEPTIDTIDYDKKTYEFDNSIVDYNPNGATLENSRFISKKGISKIYLNEGYKFLNISKDTILATNDFGSLYLNDGQNINFIEFKHKIVSAAKKDNLLAVEFSNNSIILYDLDEKKIKYKEYFNESILNDTQIASAIFLDTIVLFPTLDGKIILVDYNKFTKIKTINLDPKSQVNNIIYLNTIGDTLVAATDHKIFTFSNGRVHIENFDIMHLTIKGKFIYLATLDGNIIKLDQNLRIIKKKKFKFAKFVTIGAGKSYIYALDIQGYLVSVDENLEDLLIFDISYDEGDKVFSLDGKLYFDDRYIVLD